MAYSWKLILVQDAYRVFKFADALYGCNPSWWRLHRNCDGCEAPKWSTHHEDMTNNKLALADELGIRLVEGRHGDEFSLDPSYINYGSNSGFQAINLAILLGCKKIVLVGFDMRCKNGKGHFFGNHPGGELRQNTDEEYRNFVRHYERAAKALPASISIVNATPGSALTCFPMLSLEDALSTFGSPQT